MVESKNLKKRVFTYETRLSASSFVSKELNSKYVYHLSHAETPLQKGNSNIYVRVEEYGASIFKNRPSN